VHKILAKVFASNRTLHFCSGISFEKHLGGEIISLGRCHKLLLTWKTVKILKGNHLHKLSLMVVTIRYYRAQCVVMPSEILGKVAVQLETFLP